MTYFLNKAEILELLTIQDLNKSEETSKYNENKLYEFYLNYIEKEGIIFNKERLVKNYTRDYQKYDEKDPNGVDGWYIFSQLSEELATALDGKIELYSDSFWMLFDYYKADMKYDWKRQNPHVHVNMFQENKTMLRNKVNFLSKFKDNDLLDNLTGYLQRVRQLEDIFVVLWGDLALSKENANKFKNESPFNFIDMFNCVIEPKAKNTILKVKLLCLFQPEVALEWMTIMYDIHKGSAVQDKIVEIIRTLKPDFKNEEIDVFNETHEVVYQNTINIDPMSLIQKFQSSPNNIKNFFKVFDYIVNHFNNQGHRIEKDFKHKEYSYQYKQYRSFMKFVIKAYSSAHLEIEEKKFKDLFNVSADLLIPQKKILSSKEMENTLDCNNMDLLINEINHHIDYINLDKKVKANLLLEENDKIVNGGKFRKKI